jgi:hypothetical protein
MDGHPLDGADLRLKRAHQHLTTLNRTLSEAVAIPSLAVDLGPWTRRRQPDPLVGEEVGTRTITPARRRRMIPAAPPLVTDDPATSPTVDRIETGGRSPK